MMIWYILCVEIFNAEYIDERNTEILLGQKALHLSLQCQQRTVEKVFEECWWGSEKSGECDTEVATTKEEKDLR